MSFGKKTSIGVLFFVGLQTILFAQEEEVPKVIYRGYSHEGEISVINIMLGGHADRIAELEGTVGAGMITSDTVDIASTMGDVDITAAKDANITAADDANIESTNGDLNFCADVDNNSMGKVNIKSGTSSTAADAAGELGLCAKNDIVIKSEDGDVFIKALSQNINLTKLLLHVLMSARIAPVAKTGSEMAVLPNFDNAGVSNVMYSGAIVKLTIDRDTATLTVDPVSGIMGSPGTSTLRIGDEVVTTLTTTTGSKDITIEWLSNGVVEVFATP